MNLRERTQIQDASIATEAQIQEINEILKEINGAVKYTATHSGSETRQLQTVRGRKSNLKKCN